MIRGFKNKFEDNYYTKNRKLKLEEYDGDGNIIDTIELSQEDLWNFYMHKNNGFICFDIARKSDREYFSGDRLETAKRIVNLIEDRYFDIITIKQIEEILRDYTLEQINFAIDFKNYSYDIPNYMFFGEDDIFIKGLKFIDILVYFKSKNGFWYAIDDKGNRGMAYLNEPTKKQIKYQMNKHGKKIVYFNFIDCKEYRVNEDEL